MINVSNHLLLFSSPVVSNSLQLHRLQHIRPPYPSLSPGVFLSSCSQHQWCLPAISSFDTLFFFPQSFPASGCLFSNESALHIMWSKHWSFSFSITLSSEYSGLISIMTDWFDLLAVQGTLKSLLQHHNLKASILRCSVFFMVQLSHLYTTTGKTIVLTIQTFVGKLMSLLFNMLSIAFLPKASVLISWLHSSPAVILEPKKIKSVTVSILSPSICPWSVGTGWIILVFWMLSFKPAFSLSYFTFIKRLFSSSLLSAIRMVSAYLWLLVFLSAILIPACISSSPGFHMRYFAYKLNNQSDKNTALTCSVPNFEPVYFSMSGSYSCLLTCMQVSQEAGKVVWYSHLFKNFPQFVVIHSVKGFSIEAKVDVFLEFPGFLGDSDGKESANNVGDPGFIPGWEDPLENGTATHSSILPRESHGQRSLGGYSS